MEMSSNQVMSARKQAARKSQSTASLDDFNCCTLYYFTLLSVLFYCGLMCGSSINCLCIFCKVIPVTPT